MKISLVCLSTSDQLSRVPSPRLTAPDRTGKISKFNFEAYAVLEANPSQSRSPLIIGIIPVLTLISFSCSTTEQDPRVKDSATDIPRRGQEEVYRPPHGDHQHRNTYPSDCRDSAWDERRFPWRFAWVVSHVPQFTWPVIKPRPPALPPYPYCQRCRRAGPRLDNYPGVRCS